ncbi:MAG: hypothetical protein V1914_01210 [archaeon]
MRKLYILWAILILLPFVSAQEQISFQRSQVSIFLIVPAVIIGILVLILLIATFKQKMTAGILKFMSFKRVFAKPPHKQESKEQLEKKVQGITQEAYVDYMEKLKVLEKQMASASSDVAFKEFSYIVKDFFSNLVGGDHAYTDEEIAEQLEGKRKILLEFSEKISQLKYGVGLVTKGGVIELINEFKDIVSTQIKRQGSGKLPVSKNLIARIFEEDKKIFGSVKQYIEFLKKEDSRSQIHELLVDEQKILRQNIKKAKNVYNDILRLYCQLSPEERKKIYPKLLRFYDNVNKMVFSSLYSEKSKKELVYFSKELERIRDVPKPQSLLRKFTSIPGSFPKVKREISDELTKVGQETEVPRFKPAKKDSKFFEIKFRIPKLSGLFERKPVVRPERFRVPSAPVRIKKVFRVPKIRLPSLDFLKFKLFGKKRLEELPELKIPGVSKVKKPSADIKIPVLPMVRRLSVFGKLKNMFIGLKKREVGLKGKLRRKELMFEREGEREWEKIKSFKDKFGKPGVPEVKLPKILEPGLKKSVPIPVADHRSSLLESIKLKLSGIMRPKPHRVPMQLELKDEGKIKVLSHVVQEPKVVPKSNIMIPESLSLGVPKEGKVIEKRPLAVKRPVMFFRIKNEVLPRINQVVKVILRDKIKEGYRKSSETHLMELEKIKTVVKEKPIRKLKPSSFQTEEQQILSKIDMLIGSTRPIEVFSLFDKVYALLEKAKSELAQKEYTKAEVTYESIKPVYLGLSEREKKIVYPRLFDFYKHLTAALAAYRVVRPTKDRQDTVLLKEEEDLLNKLEALKNAIS